ncbi:MAG: PEP-CTERM sorting domain-containing protein [Phycisphaerales bacterium]
MGCDIGNRVNRLAGVGFVFGVLAACSWAAANPSIPTALDVGGYRNTMPNEGYLAHTVNPSVGRFGEEWTGWVDVRAPWIGGPADTNFGYDRSDRNYSVRTNVLTDANGIVGAPNFATDFDYANKIYMLQAGVSVIQTANRNITSGLAGSPAFTVPLSNAEEQAIMTNLNAAAPTIETYYAGSNAGGNSLNSGAFGETYNPSLIAGGANEGVFMASQPAPRVDTFAHELFHFVGDGLAVQSPNGGDPAHSTDANNLIASGGIRNIPTSTNQVGPPISGSVGGVDQITSPQVQRMFAATGATPYLNNIDNGGAAGDHVDWDFAADDRQYTVTDATGTKNFGVENIPGADNHQGVDSMFWGIQPTIASSQVGKDKTGLGTFAATPDFAGPTFRYADVFSMGLRYSDSDVNAAGGLSLREECLDYNLFFLLPDNSIVQGMAVSVFIGGWTGNSFADDYLARWLAPADAIGVYIYALNGDGYEGVAQIDAVIVSQVPEPATVIILLTICLFVIARRPAARRLLLAA